MTPDRANVSSLDKPMNLQLLLTERHDGQDDGDADGRPGHPQGLLTVALSLVGLQAHAALQKTWGRFVFIHHSRFKQLY